MLRLGNWQTGLGFLLCSYKTKFVSSALSRSVVFTRSLYRGKSRGLSCRFKESTLRECLRHFANGV